MEFSKPGNVAADQRSHVGAAYSALVGWGARRTLPAGLRALAYRAFARAVGANLEEAELDLSAYPSLGEFFARRLRDGARSIDSAPDAVISPCDGAIAACGLADDGQLLQAKGRTYQLGELIADDVLARQLTGGSYVTVYLSPRDYHRVHTPVAGRIVSYDYLPGQLWPVNPRLAGRRDGLLARNERVVIRIDAGPVGHVALVMVGAAGVGNIRLAHAPDSVEFRGREHHRIELTGVMVQRGDELGAFRLGSTVVMIAEPGAVQLEVTAGQSVQFGQRIGQRIDQRIDGRRRG
ncbi:MAG: archaetidylserine decarboxylase [Kofleriaceae bacterium]